MQLLLTTSLSRALVLITEVYQKLLCRSTLATQVLMEMDELYGIRNPLDSVLKLSVVVRKCSGYRDAVQRMEFVLSLMCDLFNSEALRPGDFSKHSMEGSGAHPPKGSVDVALAKRDILQYLLRFCHDELRNADVFEKLQEITASVTTFRTHVGRWWKPSQVVPMPWRSSWRASADLLLSMLERAVFHSEMDDFILQWLRSRKSLQDFFAQAPASDMLEEIREKLQAEGNDQTVAAAAEAIVATDENAAEDDGDARLVFGIEALDILQDVPLAEMDDSDKNKLARFKAQARALVASHIFLIEETAEADCIRTCMNQAMCKASQELADGEHILIYYGQTEGGECSAQPHLRAPPLRNRGEHLRSFVQNCKRPQDYAGQAKVE